MFGCHVLQAKTWRPCGHFNRSWSSEYWHLYLCSSSCFGATASRLDDDYSGFSCTHDTSSTTVILYLFKGKRPVSFPCRKKIFQIMNHFKFIHFIDSSQDCNVSWWNLIEFKESSNKLIKYSSITMSRNRFTIIIMIAVDSNRNKMWT